jgi:type I restriction enzyme, S subunit
MQTSVVNYKELNFELRIDAEYYRAEVLDTIHRLDKIKHDVLENLASFVVGPFGSTVTVDQYVSKSDYRYVRNKDINDFIISDDEPALIPEDVYKRLPQFHLRENDLLITVVGTLGKVAIAQAKDSKSIFSCKSTLIRLKGIDPFYLLSYLNSKTGQIFALRGIRGVIQQGLNLSDLKEIKVFIPSKEFQSCIKQVVCESFNLIKKANDYYSQAEQMLLSELDLLNWKPKHRISFVKDFSDTQSAGRIDAEYFQPMYEEIVKELMKYKNGYNLLGDSVKIKDKNFIPKDEISYKYIELADISINGNITVFTETLGKELPTRARRKVNTGDVIVSSVEGSLSSIALITESLNNALCSTGFYVVNSENINSETLLVFLKSKAGQLQLKKGCSGTILTAISKDELAKIIIPKISNKIQHGIKAKITVMYEAKASSNELLNIAKRGVELAIEKNEKQAQKWIDVELKKMNIV